MTRNRSEKDKPSEEKQTLDSLLAEKEEVPVIEDLTKLAKLDPVRRYLLEVSKFEPLTPEEEHQLAILYRKENDQEAAYRLVTSNLRLVVTIARLYNRIYTNIMDLIQEGNIGLMEAVKRFDPYRNATLPTYASWWIKAYIIKFILDNYRLVRVGTTNERRKLLFNLRKEKERLHLQGIEPTPEVIAKRLNVKVEDVRAVEQSIASSDLSLETPISKDGSLRYIDTLQAAEDLIDEKLARGELRQLFKEKLQELAKTLNEREKVILYERLVAVDPATLQKIAGRFGVSREAIRQSEKGLINKIKVFMTEALGNVRDVEFALIK